MGTGLNALGEKQVNFSLDGANDGLAGTQADPAVVALSNGDFVVVYENPEAGSNVDLLAHFFDASGNAIGPPASSGLLNGVVGIDRTVDPTIHPAVAATPDGGFLVAYTDTAATDNTIVVKRYDPTTGVSAPFVIDTGAGLIHQPNIGPVDSPAIAAFADGTSIVVWEFDFADSATDHDLYFAFLNSAANGFTHATNTLAVSNNFEGEARVASSGNLAAIVYAVNPGTIGGGQDVVLRLFNSSATEAAAPSTIFGFQNGDVFSHPDVAALSDGRFVVVAQDDTTSTLVASIYDPVTHAVTPVVDFASLTGAGTNPHVAGAPGGGFVVSFDTPTGDVAEIRYGAGGSSPFGGDFVNFFTTGAQDQNAIAANANGTVFFAWQDAGSGNPNSTDADTRIEAQAFRLQQPAQPNFEGGGLSDVLLRNASGSFAEWTMSGSAVTASNLLTSGGNAVTLSSAWTVNGVADLSGDGKSDVLLRNSNGTFADWTMNGSQIASSQLLTSQGATVTLGSAWNVSGLGDFNGDGKSDVLLHNTNGTFADWTMNGSKIASSQLLTSQGATVTLGSVWSVAGIGDFDGDGKADVLLRNTNGTFADWTMNGSKIASSQLLTSQGATVTLGSAWSVAGVGDFNGDGLADVLLRNSNGTLADWTMNGSKIASAQLLTSQGATVTLDPSWSIAALGDFIADGKSDILLKNASGAFVEWMMNGSAITAATHVTANGQPVAAPAWQVQANPTDAPFG